jgi:hypothetical protein
MHKWLWILFFPLAAQAAGEGHGRPAAWGLRSIIVVSRCLHARYLLLNLPPA